MYYVYLHRRKDNNEVFYVGKGKDNRANSKQGRNKWWKNIANKHGFSVEYVKCGLSEDEALELEIKTIKQYRDNNLYLCNVSSGGEGASGCKRTESQKKFLSDTMKKIRSNMPCTRVVCSNGMVFVSANMAAEWLRSNGYKFASRQGVLNCCNGKRESFSGFQWQYWENRHKLKELTK